jgi:cell division protein FtsW (lipid II flippase)
MWDAKRQIIWLMTAVALVTFVVYQNALDETGNFDPAYFALLEFIFLFVIVIMFYIYSRKSSGK